MRIFALPAAAVLTACTTAYMGGGGPSQQPESNAPPATGELTSLANGPGWYGGGPPGPGMMGGMSRGMGRGPYGGMGPGMMMGPRFQPQTTLTRSSGGRLLAEYCSQCHAVPSPAQHTPPQWPAVVSRMQRYMQASGAQISHPSAPQIRAVLHYLERHAAREQAAQG